MVKSVTKKVTALTSHSHTPKDRKAARRKIAAAGVKWAACLPSKKQIATISNRPLQDYLTAVRHYAVEAKRAKSWDDAELDQFASALALADATAEILLTTLTPAHEGEPAERRVISCTENCRLEKNGCMQECINLGGVEFPCWCCGDCRLHNVACLADCILNSAGGGTGSAGLAVSTTAQA
jgi:hypothetical protein